MNIDIICPLYNAENYIVDLQKSIELQSKYGNINNIRYIITKGKDNTEKLVEQIKEYSFIYESYIIRLYF